MNEQGAIVAFGAVVVSLLTIAVLPPGEFPDGVTVPGFRLAAAETKPVLPACDGIEDVQKIKRMMERGFDSAFTAQIGQLYKVYTTNAPSVEKQREYTKRGMESAIAAYRVGISAVEHWEC